MCSTLVEIQGVLYNRPLTYADNDATLESLTPNQLILGRRLSFSTDVLRNRAPEVLNHADLSKRLAYTLVYKQKLISDFKQRWSRDYLVNLREPTKI